MDDMESTFTKIGQMESRLTALAEENMELRNKLKESHSSPRYVSDVDNGDDDVVKSPAILSSTSSPLKGSTMVQSPGPVSPSPHTAHKSRVGRIELPTADASVRQQELTIPETIPVELAGHSYSPTDLSECRLRTLQELATSIKRAQSDHGRRSDNLGGDHPTGTGGTVTFDADLLLSCLAHIQQESEELAVLSSTAATTALLRQVKHRNIHRVDQAESVDGVQDVLLREARGRSDRLNSSTPAPRAHDREAPVLYVDTDTLKGGSDAMSDLAPSPEATQVRCHRISAELFKLIDTNSDGRISLVEFIRALRSQRRVADVSATTLHVSIFFQSSYTV